MFLSSPAGSPTANVVCSVVVLCLQSWTRKQALTDEASILWDMHELCLLSCTLSAFPQVCFYTYHTGFSVHQNLSNICYDWQKQSIIHNICTNTWNLHVAIKPYKDTSGMSLTITNTKKGGPLKFLRNEKKNPDISPLFHAFKVK